MNTFTEISLRLQGLNVVFLFPYIALFAAKVFNIENYFHISIQVCDVFWTRQPNELLIISCERSLHINQFSSDKKFFRSCSLLVRVRMVLGRTVFGSAHWRFDNLGGSNYHPYEQTTRSTLTPSLETFTGNIFWAYFEVFASSRPYFNM